MDHVVADTVAPVELPYVAGTGHITFHTGHAGTGSQVESGIAAVIQAKNVPDSLIG